MSNPTLHDNFHLFGAVYYQPLESETDDLFCMQLATHTKTVDRLFRFPCEVCVEPVSGLAKIVFCTQPEATEPHAFALRHYVKIKPGIFFNIVSVSAKATCRLLAVDGRFTQYALSTPYTPRPSPIPFNILEILDHHYVAGQPQYCFHAAAHSYYELLYVDRGTLTVTAVGTSHILGAGDVIVYGPDSAHGKHLAKESGCSYLSVVFDMELTGPHRLLRRVFHSADGLRDALDKLIEADGTQSPHGRTLMICYLQAAVTRLLQLCEALDGEPPVPSHSLQQDLLEQILAYMGDHVTEPITIEQICRKFFLSRSSLQTMFKTHLNHSPKSYLLGIKLQKSKDLIRENQYTISEIAEMLGFSSIHYFSRLFKKYFGLSPSEYAKHVFARESL
ncbi:MAG: AraC family transcriptional regulator [Agathobaculum sp.]|uniref:helix-turn-helix transcriptional regulator n=1 Tax=Agathobaculum sp. TaxID=2048138 RepID=UPI0025BF5A99|nr:AraC family transcriptional regulator [Agathobaculum sp.]MCI7125424.1 AraC family transcriptional regulator [Agathobaculum sp.]